jgi:hypothetical protein
MGENRDQDWQQEPRYDAGHPANNNTPYNGGDTGNAGDKSNVNTPGTPNNGGYPNDTTEGIDARVEEIRRAVVQGASEAQQRLRRVFGKASEYLQQGQEPLTPRYAATAEDQRIRLLANTWSNENWRVAKDLGTYMDILSSSIHEVWEVTVQTRWETRTMESVVEPYTGSVPGTKLQPILPIWDYDLPLETNLKAPPTRIRLEGLDEVTSCVPCNATGHVACAGCNGRGWIVCPDCKGRIKKRCDTCRGRGYIADWAATTTETKKQSFFRRQAGNVASSVGERVSDVFDNIRQQGVPIPNPLDIDPASKGPTIPCPDCVNGEVDCTCGNGKRVCPTCQGAKVTLCQHCGGTGKVVRHRELARRFDLSTATRIIGESPIPQQQLTDAGGELVYSAEVDDTFHPEVAPDNVPVDVWRTAVDMVKAESHRDPKSQTTRPLNQNAQSASHATLQVIELVRVPYTQVQYRYSGQNYVFYAYDANGREKFYADSYPARWNRVERLVQAISNDLATSPFEQGQSQRQDQAQNRETPGTETGQTPPNSNNGYSGGYRVPIEYPPYNISEEDEGDTTEKHS